MSLRKDNIHSNMQHHQLHQLNDKDIFLNLVRIYGDQSKNVQNPAVVFDIDGTLIRNNRTPITPIISFYNYCVNNRIPTFIITARIGTS